MSDVIEAAKKWFSDEAEIFSIVARKLDERRELGNFRYGVPLDPWDRRNWVKEGEQEVGDSIVYFQAHAIQQSGGQQTVSDYFVAKAYEKVREAMVFLARAERGW